MSKSQPTQAELEAEYKLFTDSIERAEAYLAQVSPPAQKPASVPGGSGAGLVGTPPDFGQWCLTRMAELSEQMAAEFSGDDFGKVADQFQRVSFAHGVWWDYQDAIGRMELRS